MPAARPAGPAMAVGADADTGAGRGDRDGEVTTTGETTPTRPMAAAAARRISKQQLLQQLQVFDVWVSGKRTKVVFIRVAADTRDSFPPL